jgi:Zn-dependent protease with chaperone function
MSALLVLMLIGQTYVLAVMLTARRHEQESERGTAELTEEDRNLLKRHIRALEDNTTAQRKGRPQ